MMTRIKKILEEISDDEPAYFILVGGGIKDIWLPCPDPKQFYNIVKDYCSKNKLKYIGPSGSTSADAIDYDVFIASLAKNSWLFKEWNYDTHEYEIPDLSNPDDYIAAYLKKRKNGFENQATGAYDFQIWSASDKRDLEKSRSQEY